MIGDNTNNKRIAKNTIFLYIRMLLTMAVAIYTSRVVLAKLGVTDYGIYNVVGGVVTMFAFLNGTMSGVTQRYLTYELGTGNHYKLSKVFNTAMCLHWIISIIVFIMAETIGLWFVCNKLVIPDNRIDTAFWVYQFSIISTIVLIVSIPYNACIVAHEKMAAFAYISILDVSLKLGIVYLLDVIGGDKLLVYAALMLFVHVLIRVVYNVYCKKHFPESKFSFALDKQLAKEMSSFTSWSLFGGFASVGLNQGINILLNMFFGPAVNAARAIAVQVDTAVHSFVQNFQMAMKPQIVKNYASGNISQMHSLIFASSKYSYYLLLLLSLPIILEASFVLRIWLVEVPEYSIPFLRITMLVALINTLSTPLMTAANANGNIRNYQIICGSIQLLVVPVAYIFLLIGSDPVIVFWVYFVVSILVQIARIFIVSSLVNISKKHYLKDVIIPIAKVSLVAVWPPIAFYMFMNQCLIRFVGVVLLSCISVIASVFIIGINQKERTYVVTKMRYLISKFRFNG